MIESILKRNLQPTWTRVQDINWPLLAVGIHVFFTLTTVLSPYLPSSIDNAFFHHLDLSRENNIAVWWSAINLFILALLALAQAAKTGDKKNHFAWIILSLFFAVLSVDEIGSLHERVSWEALFFPAAVLGLFLSGALVIFYQNEEDRKLLWPVTFGIALWGLVALLDHLEDLILFPSWSAGMRNGVEEGLELLGMAIILTALTGKRPSLKGPGNGSFTGILNPWELSPLPVIVTAGLVIHAGFSFAAASFSDLSQRGNPAIWYPMALFFLLFSACIWMTMGQPAGQGKAWLVLAIYFLLSSIAAVYLISPRQSISKVYSLGLFSNFYFLHAYQLILSLIFYRLVFGPLAKKTLFIIFMFAALLVLGFLLDNLVLQFLIAGIFAYLILYLFLFEGRSRMESGLLPIWLLKSTGGENS